MNTNKDNLVAEIKSNFPTKPIPTNAAGRDGNSDVQDEYYYVATYFKDRKWCDIRSNGLWNDYSGPPDACLTFMSVEGGVYYLPAFMTIFLSDYNQADVIADSVINFIIPSDSPYIIEWQKERHKLFNASQRETIRNFISYVENSHAEDYDLQQLKAAHEYWQ